MLNPELVVLYMEGDAIGAPYENKPTFEAPRMNLPPRTGGTDESDTLMCWLEYQKAADSEGVFCSPFFWARYFTNNHKPAGYGKTYPDFFRLVSYLDKRGKLNIDKLVEISQDRNSMGNGCLSLVAPLVAYAIENKLDVRETVYDYTIITHANRLAIGACDILAVYLEGKHGGDISPLHPGSIGGQPDAMATLVTAFWCASMPTKDLVITEAIMIGGDTDSILALALLLWGVKNGIPII